MSFHLVIYNYGVYISRLWWVMLHWIQYFIFLQNTDFVFFGCGPSYFLIAVIKCFYQKQLRVKGSLLTHSPREIKSIAAGKTWQQSGKAWWQDQETLQLQCVILRKQRIMYAYSVHFLSQSRYAVQRTSINAISKIPAGMPTRLFPRRF